jgi:heat shock protein HslJ
LFLKSLVVLIIVFLTSACAGSTPDSIVGTWKLVSYGDAANLTHPIPGVDTSIMFNEDGSVGGNVGCNSLGGKYKVSGNKIVFSEMLYTAMACEEPLMIQESSVFGLLNGERTFTYEESNGTLVILSPDEKRAVALQK